MKLLYVFNMPSEHSVMRLGVVQGRMPPAYARQGRLVRLLEQLQQCVINIER